MSLFWAAGGLLVLELVAYQGIVGCTPTNVPLWEIPILALDSGYLLFFFIPKNPQRTPAKYHGTTRTLGVHPCFTGGSRGNVLSQPMLLASFLMLDFLKIESEKWQVFALRIPPLDPGQWKGECLNLYV